MSVVWKLIDVGFSSCKQVLKSPSLESMLAGAQKHAYITLSAWNVNQVCSKPLFVRGVELIRMERLAGSLINHVGAPNTLAFFFSLHPQWRNIAYRGCFSSALLSPVSVCVMERRRAAGQQRGLSAHSCPLMHSVWGTDNLQRPDCVLENWFLGPRVQITPALSFENVCRDFKSELDDRKPPDLHFKGVYTFVLVVALFWFAKKCHNKCKIVSDDKLCDAMTLRRLNI